MLQINTSKEALRPQSVVPPNPVIPVPVPVSTDTKFGSIADCGEDGFVDVSLFQRWQGVSSDFRARMFDAERERLNRRLARYWPPQTPLAPPPLPITSDSAGSGGGETDKPPARDLYSYPAASEWRKRFIAALEAVVGSGSGCGRSAAAAVTAGTGTGFGGVPHELIGVISEYAVPPFECYVEWIMDAARFVPEQYASASNSSNHFRVYIPSDGEGRVLKSIPAIRRINKSTHTDRNWPFNWRATFKVHDRTAKHIIGSDAVAAIKRYNIIPGAELLAQMQARIKKEEETKTSAADPESDTRTKSRPPVAGGNFRTFMKRFLELTRTWQSEWEESTARTQQSIDKLKAKPAVGNVSEHPMETAARLKREALGLELQSEDGFDWFTRLVFDAVSLNWMSSEGLTATFEDRAYWPTGGGCEEGYIYTVTFTVHTPPPPGSKSVETAEGRVVLIIQTADVQVLS